MALEVTLWALAIALTLPVGVVVLETALATLPARRPAPGAGDRPSVGVLIPAHNEQKGVARTVREALAQLGEGDRLVVVADNCTDNTAEAARDAGAEVVERHDAEHRGKGYALAHGLSVFDENPPDVIVMIDADCALEPSAIDALACDAGRGQVAQGVYLMRPPTPASPRDAVSALAVVMKNQVRPRGLDRLGLPVLLTGAGMAFPWRVIRDVDLASGNIVEDMQLGLDLAIAGSPPRLCAGARVWADLPGAGDAATSQRTRWEHGHLRTLLTQAPRLLGSGLLGARPGLIALGLELAVPPLALLVMAALGIAALAWGGVAFGLTAGPAMTLTIALAALTLAVLIAWAGFARAIVPLGALLAAPLYVMWKIPLYLGFARRAETRWVRTERDASGPNATTPGASS